MFEPMAPGLHVFDPIPGFDGIFCLAYYRAIIELGGDQVNTDTVLRHAIVERSLMGIQALVGGQQRGMNVENSMFESLYDCGTQDTHEASQYNIVYRDGLEVLL